jgi:hypothetical protein
MQKAIDEQFNIRYRVIHSMILFISVIVIANFKNHS